MANNYNISNWVTNESSGDSVANGTILSPVYLYITPHTGYALQASDFSIGSSLPAEVVLVRFTDTTTALDSTNLVKVTVDLAPWYTHGSSDFDINIDIDGSTHAVKSRLNFTTVHNSGVSNITQALTATNKTAATSGDITTNTCYLDVENNTTTTVAAFTYTAASGYHLVSVPTFTINSSDITKWSSTASDQTYNSDNQLTSIKYSFDYSIENVSIPLSSGESLIFDAPELEADRDPCTRISSVYYSGFANESTLPNTSNFITLNVYGNENATYTIRIENDLGLFYNFETDAFAREGSPYSAEQTIYSPSKQIALGRNLNYNTHSIVIPEGFPEQGSSSFFTTTVTPTGSTKSNSCSGTEPYVVRLNKFGEVDYTIVTAASTYGVNGASTSVKSVLNKVPLSTLSIFNPVDNPSLDATNNGYFSYSQVLSHSSTSTTNLAVAGGTNVALDHTTASLKLRVGDAVTGTNIAEGTVISALNPTNDYDITISASIPSYPLADETSLTFTRTVGISRQPTVDDIRTTSPITTYKNLYDHAIHTVTASSSGTIVTIKSDDVSDLAIGMLVQGDNIIGHPTIVSFSANSIVLSTSQSLNAGDALSFSVAGSKIWIEDINVTGAGTANCKLNIDGYIEKMGNVDVAAEIVLSNFVTVYAAPTITATTATVALGSSVKIYPLLTDTSTIASLEISEITSSGSGTTSLSSDKQSIKYLAPATGTTDTISYKISDGISAESSAANIVITLTP
tara:strand:+ start:5295 stop:7520 length:2226 start_codon:yes stop_codon:yes gene_type:complete